MGAHIVVNTDGFYDGFKMQMERIFAEGFLSAKEQNGANSVAMSDIVRFVDTPKDAMQLLGRPSGDTPSIQVPTAT